MIFSFSNPFFSKLAITKNIYNCSYRSPPMLSLVIVFEICLEKVAMAQTFIIQANPIFTFFNPSPP